MRILTLNLVNQSIVNIALGGSAVITFAGLPVSKESRARSVVVIFTPDGRIAYEALETVDQIAEMLTEPAQSSPTDADIQRRIALLTKAATLDAHPDRISGVDSHYATFDDRFLLTEWTEGGYPLPEWKDVDEAMFRREIERVAIRQLLTDRGGK